MREGKRRFDDIKKVKKISLASVYGINLFFTICLWLCGLGGNILIGIFAILFYRLSLWAAPLTVTVICWIPLESKVPIYKKALLNLLLLFLCGVLFFVCYLIPGGWY